MEDESEYHEMKDRGEQEEDQEGDQETSFIENDSDDEYKISFIKNNPDDDVIISEERSLDHESTKDFFTNILYLGPKCSDPEFIDYLIDNGILDIKRELGVSNSVIDYTVNHIGEYFKSVNRSLSKDDTNLLRDGIRLHYDEWTGGKMNKILKKAGIATAIGLSIIALVSGLSIGLTRKGADMVYQAKMWEKLTPAKKPKEKVIPWTSLEKATGKVVIFTGEHILVIIAIGGVFLYKKK